MKKTTLFLVFALLGFHFAAQAQALEIVNNRNCAIVVNVHVNGPCFGTGTCSLPAGGMITFNIPALSSTPVFTTLAAASSYTGGTLSCPFGTYEYVRADVQYALECDCGGGVAVGVACMAYPPASLSFGPTCYAGPDCPTMPCAVMTSPFGAGSARIVAY